MNLISCHYTEKIRLLSRKKYTELSPIEYWNKNYDKVIAKSKELILSEDDIVHDLQRSDTFKIREILYRETKEVTIFKPTWIIAILKHLYGEHIKGKKYLDISAGWGDRLITSILFGMEYTGYDPNPLLIDCYNNIINDIGNSEIHKVICQPFEDSEIEPNKYDIVLSSPPFFDLELYYPHQIDHGDGYQNQSTTRYTNFDDWVNNFLFVSVNKAVDSLKSKGYLVLYLSELFDFKYIDNLFDMLYQERKTKYIGCIGLCGVRQEYHPTWIWQKL